MFPIACLKETVKMAFGIHSPETIPMFRFQHAEAKPNSTRKSLFIPGTVHRSHA
jgi:hypothetical protein